MSSPIRALGLRLAVRVALVAVWLVLHELFARWLAGWDAGLHLLAGGPSAGVALGALLGFFALHAVTYFVLPPLVTISCVGAVARYLDERRAEAT